MKDGEFYAIKQIYQKIESFTFIGVAHASDFLSLKLPNCGLVLFMP